MIYKRIRNLREDKDMTQQQIAELLFINRRTYSNYEIGTRTVPPEILIKLAHLHDVSIDYLLDLTNDPMPYHRKK